MHDVIVVGAGPTGCYVARELTRRGYRVLVLEEHQLVGEPVHCTGIIGAEVFRRFDLDPGSIETQLCSARIFSPSGQSFRVASKDPRAVVVDRSQFDRHLAGQALSHGASFLLGMRVTDVRPTEQGVYVTAGDRHSSHTFPASLVILATGVERSLTERLGLAQPAEQMLTGAQLIAETADLTEVEVHFGQTTAPGGFAWAVPGNGHGCRIGLVCRDRPQGRLRAFATRLEQRGAIGRPQGPIRCRPIPTGGRTPSYTDRVLVVGDAAGQVKSTTSGGVYYGLLGAEAAVAVADEALQQHDVSASRLAVYEQTWRARIGVEQAAGRLCRRLQSGLRDRDLEALFWVARRTGLPRVLSRLRFDWHATSLLSLLWREAGAGGAAIQPAR